MAIFGAAAATRPRSIRASTSRRRSNSRRRRSCWRSVSTSFAVGLMIFDPDWLLADHREDDFSLGLAGWSVQQYLKSVPGNFRGVSGHCAYNRRAGASLVPHPDGQPREVLQVARHPDPRLVHEVEGAVWNFPCWPRGSLKLRLRMPQGSQGVQICLADRWFNPVDPVVARFAQHVLRLDAAGRINSVPCVKPDTWADVEIRWDGDAARFPRFGRRVARPAPRLPNPQRDQLPSFAECGDGSRSRGRARRIGGGVCCGLARGNSCRNQATERVEKT